MVAYLKPVEDVIYRWPRRSIDVDTTNSLTMLKIRPKRCKWSLYFGKGIFPLDVVICFQHFLTSREVLLVFPLDVVICFQHFLTSREVLLVCLKTFSLFLRCCSKTVI